MQHFCHHGDTICHPKSCYVTTKLHGTSTRVDATIMLYFHTELFSRFLPSAHSGHVNLAATKPCQVGSSCQSTEMATLLNHYISCLKFRFCLSVVSYNYYDYTVRWCSLINCNGCVWLDIVYMLALNWLET